MLEKFIEITGYALADAVNPCAIAVLTMVLVSILINNPGRKNIVLKTGLLFSLSVFMGYFVYAGILVQLFKGFASFFASNSFNIKIIFAILAMIIGALNIKNFFCYKKGGILTEMPLFLRPKVKKIIEKITQPKGAFLLGFFITLFLLPCTAGPLVLAAASLSELGFLQVTLWFIYYNLIFISPMILITLLVYFGHSKAEEISDWKERNIKILHLIAGILLFLIGLGILNNYF